jgi:hypothetical protein
MYPRTSCRRNPSLDRDLLNPNLDHFAGLDDVFLGFAAVAADGEHILGALAAQFFEGQVVQVVAEGVLDLDADLLNAEERVGDAQDGRPSQNRSYDELVRKTSNNPSAVPTNV